MSKTEIGTNAVFTGPQKGLTTIGEHCYAYSGTYGAYGSSQTLLDFTTGSNYIIATLTMTAPYPLSSVGAGYVRGYQLKFNDQYVGFYKVDGGAEDMPTAVQVEILIPPFTAVVLTSIDNTTDSEYLGTANLTGRIYEGK